MEIIIISGRSGAGKSVALRALEESRAHRQPRLPLRTNPAQPRNHGNRTRFSGTSRARLHQPACGLPGSRWRLQQHRQTQHLPH